MTKPSIDTSPRALRKFGITFALLCLVAGTYAFLKHTGTWPWFGAGSLFFLITGLAVHAILRPVYVGWMTFAHVLGWVNTRLILGLFYFAILTPLGVALRLLGKDLLDQRIDRAAPSYWRKRETPTFDPKRYEQLF